MKLAVSLIGKASDVIVTAVGRPNDMTIQLTGSPLTGWQKRIQGALFGGANPLYDIPKILGLYRSGDMKLDELITRRYSLDQVNEGYQDMLDGKNIRGVMIFDD
jgi:S-(hydroxymethyl)glutathione dehydrogenase/alcohol dehydrogenase